MTGAEQTNEMIGLSGLLLVIFSVKVVFVEDGTCESLLGGKFSQSLKARICRILFMQYLPDI